MRVAERKVIPECDICQDAKAAFDCPTNLRGPDVIGPWALMCNMCYGKYAHPISGETGYKLEEKNGNAK